jgi:hypothetical protein
MHQIRHATKHMQRIRQIKTKMETAHLLYQQGSTMATVHLPTLLYDDLIYLCTTLCCGVEIK